MADQITFNPLRAADGNGFIVPAAQARFFLSGTTTPATVYTDQTATIAHPTPLVADNRGIFPQVFSSQQLKVEIRNSSDALLPGFPIDPAPIALTSAGAAANISFEPTVLIPVTSVQAAIERVQANITTPTLAYGLGVTGSVVLMANIDATTTPSGTYRVDATTTGTFPAGFTPASGGIVEFRRETASLASMSLHHSNSDRKSVRKMYAGIWQTWREDLTANQTLVTGDLLYHNGTNLVRLAKGAAGQILRQDDALTAPIWSDNLAQSASQATTSGTAFDFTGIPAWAKRITMVFNSVSLSGTDYYLVQLGDSGGIETTGYISGSSGYATTIVTVTSAAGFTVFSESSAYAAQGLMTLVRIGSTNGWIQNHSGNLGIANFSGGGSKTLSAALDRIRLTRSGTNTFDAGSVSIMWE